MNAMEGRTRGFVLVLGTGGVAAGCFFFPDRSDYVLTGGADGTACVPPVAGPCDNFPLPQCGCLGGQNCDVTGANGETSCVAAGPKGPYSQCDGVGQCQVGATCLANDPDATVGLCKPFCEQETDCPGDGRLCAADYGAPKLRYCTLSCDLVDPAKACGAGVGCGLMIDVKHTDCAIVGAGKGPGACTNSKPTDCAPGYFCKPPDCVKWCRPAFGNADCEGGRQCAGTFPDQVVVAGVEYRACVPP